MRLVASYDPYDNSADMEELFKAIRRAKSDGFRLFQLLVPVRQAKEYL